MVLSNNLKAKVPKPPANSNIPPNSEATHKIDKRFKLQAPIDIGFNLWGLLNH